jgi:hypothetical protein
MHVSALCVIDERLLGTLEQDGSNTGLSASVPQSSPRVLRELSTVRCMSAGTPTSAYCFLSISACVGMWSAPVRVMSFLVTALIFCSLFISLALASAVITGTVHAQLSPRPAAASIAQD